MTVSVRIKIAKYVLTEEKMQAGGSNVNPVINLQKFKKHIPSMENVCVFQQSPPFNLKVPTCKNYTPVGDNDTHQNQSDKKEVYILVLDV
ncbi:hypothetical protein KIN20_027776 [Parelaphostrongylus tenuis]|uniref:Uncharacterized protein n=1 Tax=Parelaphostrongylus tenuis TaxID=148309 RepID=A0AAD5QZT2_PARTN|nr:hypothetical protein KIN20_027776 [Parelaphostrongylus tenuis]